MASEDRTAALHKNHSIILEDRKQMTLTGVRDVAAFDELKIRLDTVLGELTVKGSELHIDDFSVETGELNLKGTVDSLQYAESRQPEGGFFSRLFK